MIVRQTLAAVALLCLLPSTGRGADATKPPTALVNTSGSESRVLLLLAPTISATANPEASDRAIRGPLTAGLEELGYEVIAQEELNTRHERAAMELGGIYDIYLGDFFEDRNSQATDTAFAGVRRELDVELVFVVQLKDSGETIASIRTTICGTPSKLKKSWQSGNRGPLGRQFAGKILATCLDVRLFLLGDQGLEENAPIFEERAGVEYRTDRSGNPVVAGRKWPTEFAPPLESLAGIPAAVGHILDRVAPAPCVYSLVDGKVEKGCRR